MIIWSDEILEALEGEKKNVWVEIGNQTYPIIGIEDSQSVGWWEIRFGKDRRDTVSVDLLLSNLPRGVMVMLQEGTYSYPVNQVSKSLNGEWFLRCDDPNSEYWEELEKWKIEEDNIKIGILNFIKNELERRKSE